MVIPILVINFFDSIKPTAGLVFFKLEGGGGGPMSSSSSVGGGAFVVGFGIAIVFALQTGGD